MRSAPPRAVSDGPLRACSEFRADLGADDARVVDVSQQVGEVDAADGADLVGAIPAEYSRIIPPVRPGVSQLEARLREGRAVELLGLIQEVIDAAAIRPVGVNVQLAARGEGYVVA